MSICIRIVLNTTRIDTKRWQQMRSTAFEKEREQARMGIYEHTWTQTHAHTNTRLSYAHTNIPHRSTEAHPHIEYDAGLQFDKRSSAVSEPAEVEVKLHDTCTYRHGRKKPSFFVSQNRHTVALSSMTCSCTSRRVLLIRPWNSECTKVFHMTKVPHCE